MDPSPSPSINSCLPSRRDEAQLIFIELSSLFSVAALLILVVLGSYRRRSSSGAVRMITWVAYSACIPMVSYTMGVMQSSPYKNYLFSVWGFSLVLYLGSSNSLSAFSHKNNDNWMTLFLQLLIQISYLAVFAGQDFDWPMFAMFFLTLHKSSTRFMSFRLASRDGMLSESTKWVSDYMSYEHELCAAPGDRDPITMRGYRYIVDGEPRKEKNKPKPKAPEYLLRYDDDHIAKLVTVDKVWGCDGSLLRGGGGDRLKDLCLSMALSKMLNRRFVGLELAESKLHKTHDFLFHGLLHGEDDDSCCERAFRVIEEELAFVHDYFYTKYFAIYRHGLYDIWLSFFMIPPCIYLACNLFHHFLAPNDNLNIGILIDDHHQRNYDALLTIVIAIGIALIECFQVFFYLTSSWCKLALISKYVVRDSWNSRRWVAKLIGCITSLRSFRCWERKLGQYTLLKDFDYKPMVNPVAKMGRKQGNPVELSMDTKKALVETLKRSNGRLTNGVTSLRANDVEHQLSWSCTTLPTTTHTILTWHIATTICEAHDHVDGGRQRGGRRRLSEQEKKIDRLASLACSLSKYMAYLVAFVPDLLPDHSSVSESIVDGMVNEARKLVKGVKRKKLRKRCSKLMEMVAEAEDDDNRLIITGARLASHLMVKIQDPALRWKVVSDFWTEMLLHVAPSDDAKAHAHLETLPRGGELITHLWALLTRGGILERVTGPTHRV